MENVRKHRDIKLVTIEETRIYLELERNYHTANFFSENLLAIELKKAHNYLGLFRQCMSFGKIT